MNITTNADELTPTTFYSQPTFDDPFLKCSQDVDAYFAYQNKVLNGGRDVSLPENSKRAKENSKKAENRKNKTINNTLNSYIIKKNKKGRRAIQINISNLEQDNESQEVAVQYIVEDDFDEILSAAEGLVDKIAKKLGNVNY